MTARDLHLSLAFHNHQPVGNSPTVLAWAYRKSYLPLVETLESHPGIRVSLHYSGPLLDWILENRPEFLDRLASLAGRGQVEIMGGGYYEPILPAIPPADRAGQIRKMSSFIKDRFGQDATGLWLAERVWEPDLPSTLARAGILWTVLDDTHFRLAGLEEKDLFGYYVTEDQGYVLKVLPTSKYLRYAVPWRGVPDVIRYLKQIANAGANLAVLGDDGEKFGLWPGTYAHCWEKGWVPRFFDALERNRDWLHTTPLGEYTVSHPPLGRVYLPTAAYDEMMEWALPAERSLELTELKHRLSEEGREDILRFLAGGFWRSFLTKYPEVNNMHKKMLWVHRQVYRSNESTQDQAALDELWKGQCNCPYWHGVFGGIYLNGIRAETFSHLIEAQNRLSAGGPGRAPGLTAVMADFDCDGREELLIEGSHFNLYLSPDQGGSVFEWDLRRPAYNLTSTLSSRPEAYHQELLAALEDPYREPKPGEVTTIHSGLRVKEPGLARKLRYDSYRRVALIDHFLKPELRRTEFHSGRYQEMGDFTTNRYQAQTAESPLGLRAILTRDGHLSYTGKQASFQVVKELEISRNRPLFTAYYRLTNTSSGLASGWFGSEWSLHLLGGGGDPECLAHFGGRDLRLDASGQSKSVDRLSLVNRWLGIYLTMRASRRLTLWQLPLEAISNSEGGLERTFQGTCLMALVPFHLEPGESLAFSLEWDQTATPDS
ncbi:MAG: DUF1926 domain-containing protein [Dehalococcoidia bacterium]|nr:DUF1926 domain-containing protein [Dehalococcoidia bacterium]